MISQLSFTVNHFTCIKVIQFQNYLSKTYDFVLIIKESNTAQFNKI